MVRAGLGLDIRLTMSLKGFSDAGKLLSSPSPRSGVKGHSEICHSFLLGRGRGQIVYFCNMKCYRAVASYVTTVNQLYISLLILGYLRYLPRLCGKKSGWLYNELRNESSLELKLLLC